MRVEVHGMTSNEEPGKTVLVAIFSNAFKSKRKMKYFH